MSRTSDNTETERNLFTMKKGVIGVDSSILLIGYSGIFSNTSLSHCLGLTPHWIQGPKEDYYFAALLAPLCDPANR